MIDILKRAARAGGDVLLKHFGQKHTIKHKTTHQNIVTTADIESQRVIHNSILSSMKRKGYSEGEIGFISEENLLVRGKHTFIIDPLDGTNNFASGFEFFCMPIAYLKDGELAASVIYWPTQDRMYHATLGNGTYKGNKRLSVQSHPLTEILAVATLSSDPKIRTAQVKLHTTLHPNIRGFRNIGCAGLDFGLFLENVFGAVLNGHNYIWDIAAAKLMIEESGGVLVDWQGSPITLDLDKPDRPYQILACHPKNLPKIIKYF